MIYSKKKELILENEILEDNSLQILDIQNTQQHYIHYFEENDIANIKRTMRRKNKILYKSLFYWYKDIFNTSLSKLYHLCKLKILEEPVCSICGKPVWFDLKNGYKEKCRVCNRKEANNNRKTNIYLDNDFDNKEIKIQVLQIIETVNPKSFYQSILSRNPTLVNKIFGRTLYLNMSVKFNERIYHIIHDLFDINICKICNKNLQTFLDFNRGYSITCSYLCSGKLERDSEKIKNTLTYKHFQSRIYKIKNNFNILEIENNNLLLECMFCQTRRNFDISKFLLVPICNCRSKGEKIFHTKEKKYGNGCYINSYKTKETCNIRYGVDHHMHNATIAEKCNGRYKWKDYTLPSGKVIKVQGYEPKALDELLKTYHEDEIITSRKDIPAIWYFTEDGKKHRYYADIWIPKENLIIEVKSTYTYEIQKEINLLKEEATLKNKFNFKLMIY